MHLVKIDAVGAKTAQGIFYLLADPLRCRIAVDVPVNPFEGHFSCQHRLVAAPSIRQSLSDNLLRVAKSVYRRRVYQTNSYVHGVLNCLYRFSLIVPTPHPTSDCPGSETDP